MNTFKLPPNRRFVRQSRPLDFIYDPVYTVPSKVDFHKNAYNASKYADSKMQLRTNYSVMFSDVRTDNRVLACLKPNEPNYMQKFLQDYNIDGVPVYPMDCGPPFEKDDDVAGADRAKYFIKYAPVNVDAESYHLSRKADSRKTSSTSKTDGPTTMRSRGTQTDLREIETQTDPYSPPFTLPSPDDYPKVLSLIKMTWGKGLPATLDDIVTIERALTRRVIELTDRVPNQREDFVKRVKLMEKLEAQQWKDREKELEKIRALKWELVSRQLEDMKSKMARDQTIRLEKLFYKQKKENQEKLSTIKIQYLRELRKLERKYRQGKRPFKRDIILDYIDMESSIYAPLARNGLNVDQLGSAPDYQFTVHRDFETLSYLTESDAFVSKHLTFDLNDLSNRIKKLKPNRKTRILEKELSDCFEAFSNVCKPKEKSGDDEMLNSMIMKSVRRLSTPEEELICDNDEEDEEAIVILQTLIRGRAVQSLLRQEAQNNMETILQLKAAYETDPFGSLQPIAEKLALRQQQREQDEAAAKNDDVSEIFEQVEGEILSHMMGFLEKEMTRLLDERKIHALILLAERERRMLEASEAGLRQKEEDCMRANDEIWRQVIGIHQQTVDMYLEDIYLESVNRSADEGARKHVQQLARTVNDAAYVLENNIKYHDKDEIAADLVHSFLFPQVKRENMQRQMVDLHGRYYSVATQVTNAVLNSKGIVHQVLDIIGPELTKRFEEGADVVGGSYCAVEQMIHAAVETVLEEEKRASEVEEKKLAKKDSNELLRSRRSSTASLSQSAISVNSKYVRHPDTASESSLLSREETRSKMDTKSDSKLLRDSHRHEKDLEGSEGKSEKDSVVKSLKSSLKSEKDSVKSDKDSVVKSLKSSLKSEKDSVVKPLKSSLIKSEKDSVKSNTDSLEKSEKDSLTKPEKDSLTKSEKDSLQKSGKNSGQKSDKDSLPKSDKDSLPKSGKDSLAKSEKDAPPKSDEDSSRKSKDSTKEQKNSDGKKSNVSQKEDKEIEVKPSKHKNKKEITETSDVSALVSADESTEELTEKATNYDLQEEEEEEESDSKDPWKIPIDIPPQLCDIMGIKAMELETQKHEMTETTAKSFDAACVALQEMFDEVHDCFVQSEEESDKELDDDDPDQD